MLPETRGSGYPPSPMSPRSVTLADRIRGLERQHGRPARPAVTRPFEMVLRENVAYLVDDRRRDATFRRLTSARLARVIADGGMHPARRAGKLHAAATVAQTIGLDTLRRAVREDPGAARRLLKRFPGIGEPGAERVLLFNGAWTGLAPDSNALRVLVRLGYGRKAKDYARTYRSTAEAVAPELMDDPAWLVKAHQLLRIHGQEVCKNSAPRCEECSLARHCEGRRR
jgi:endonuclease-3